MGVFLRNGENEWVKKCMDYEVEGVRAELEAGQRKLAMRFEKKTVRPGIGRQLCREDAVDRWKWRTLIKDIV